MKRSKADTAALKTLIASAPGQLDKLVRALTLAIRNDIVESFNTAPPGNIYRRGAKTHTAAAPFHPPNVDYGALRASIHVLQEKPLQGIVADGVNYGAILEIGSARHNYVWPFMRPAFERMRVTGWRKIAGNFKLRVR